MGTSPYYYFFFFFASYLGYATNALQSRRVNTHGNTHHSCLSVLWSHDLRKLNSCQFFFIFFIFLAMHPKQGTNASNRNLSCVVLISLDDMLSSSPANLCWVISWQDKVMCYNLMYWPDDTMGRSNVNNKVVLLGCFLILLSTFCGLYIGAGLSLPVGYFIILELLLFK